MKFLVYFNKQKAKVQVCSELLCCNGILYFYLLLFITGIVLSWNMTLKTTPHADISSYQLFAYQEGNTAPNTSLWKKVCCFSSVLQEVILKYADLIIQCPIQ